MVQQTSGSDRRAQFELWASGQLMTFRKLLSPIKLLKLLVSLPKTHIRETANFFHKSPPNIEKCLLGPFFSEVGDEFGKIFVESKRARSRLAWPGFESFKIR